MADVRVLVLRAAGINCDEETVHCWRLAGARPDLVHINELSKNPSRLRGYQIVTIPGGFSYGDDVGAGVILAQRLELDLLDALGEHVLRGGGLLGICNGFQVLVKAGLLPGAEFRGRITVTHNDSNKFEARWVRLRVETDRCPFLMPGATIELPVEHGEGRVVTTDSAVVDELERRGLIALRYVDADGLSDSYPANPNGSVAGIAGLRDETGRIFGLMPHPDRHFDYTQHPLGTTRVMAGPPDGVQVFLNAVQYWR